MSWWQHLFSWQDDGNSASAAAEPQEGKETSFVNLTGHTLHFCRSNGMGKHYVYMPLETQGPVPTLRDILPEPSGTMQTRVGDTEHMVEVYTGGSGYRRTVIDNLRARQPGVMLIVPERVFDASEYLADYADRTDLVHIVEIPYTDVDSGTEDNIYCIGVGTQDTHETDFTMPAG